MDHVEGESERQLHSLFQQIHERRASLYAGREGTEDEVEPCAEESYWPGEDEEEEKPDESPA